MNIGKSKNDNYNFHKVHDFYFVSKFYMHLYGERKGKVNKQY